MAIVYEALDERLDRRVAIKVLHHHLQSDSIASDRFIKEARAAARIDHPNVVRIYDVGMEDNLLFIIMEYVPGVNLEELLKEKGKLTFEQTFTIMYEIGEALSEAHSLNIIHRDVKPANILIHKQGRAMLSDFGLARYLPDPRLTSDDVIVGTPMFMAPEQISKKTITPATDIYSWGVCFYTLLSGKLPYKKEEFPEILTSIRNGELCLNTEPFNLIPSTYQEIIHRCLFVNPDERIKNGKELVKLLLEAEKEKKIRVSLVELVEGYKTTSYKKEDFTAQLSDTIVVVKENKDQKKSVFKKSIYYWVIILTMLSIIIMFSLITKQKRSEIRQIASDTLNNIKKDTIDSIDLVEEKKNDAQIENIAALKIDVGSAIDKKDRKNNGKIAFAKDSTRMNVSDKKPLESEKTKESSDSGFLFVSCFPWAYVFVDGREIGITPLEKPLTLSVGTHTIALVNNFSDTIFDTVDVKADTLVKKKYRLNM
ncbi:MAG: protein kinase, partial [Chitinispirillaceae bacterium]|nr:protein kinase [Chitinispirillaceae bacterium]